MPQKQLYTYAILLLVCNIISLLLLQFEIIPSEMYQWLIFFYNISNIVDILILWYYVVKIRGQNLSSLMVVLYAITCLTGVIYDFLPELYDVGDRIRYQLIKYIIIIIESFTIIYISVQLVRNKIFDSKKQSNLKLYGYSILLTLLIILFLPFAGNMILGYGNLHYLRYLHLLNTIPMMLGIRMYYSELSDHSSDEDEELLIDSNSVRKTTS